MPEEGERIHYCCRRGVVLVFRELPHVNLFEYSYTSQKYLKLEQACLPLSRDVKHKKEPVCFVHTLEMEVTP